MHIAAFTIQSQLYQSDESIVFRAEENFTRDAVIIKLLNHDYPSNQQLKRFAQEYQLTAQLVGYNGVIQTRSLIDVGNAKAMIFEDIGGQSIDLIFGQRRTTLEQFFPLAIRCVAILDELHKQLIIHKDIKPHNIVLNPATGVVNLIDFGLATKLSRETQAVVHPENLSGTLAYISPEQTGRMNCPIDYRSDYYSLGVTFYELLTGELPFSYSDAMEMVHAHIAKLPHPPSSITAASADPVPRVVSDIVMKMIAKQPEERYQSAEGILSDLNRCYQELRQKGKVSTFPLGQDDYQFKFRIPAKLYGRDKATVTSKSQSGPDPSLRLTSIKPAALSTEEKQSFSSAEKVMPSIKPFQIIGGYTFMGTKVLIG